jgi:TonB family protein
MAGGRLSPWCHGVAFALGVATMSASASLMIAGSLCAASAGNETGPVRAPVAFDIPPQQLTTALVTYSEASGIQVLYDSRLAASRQSPGVKGVMTPQAALRRLLGGTDLVVRYTDGHDIVLLPLAPQAAIPDTPAFPDGPVLSLDTLHVGDATELGTGVNYRAYASVVQADIQSALHKDGQTRSGDYNIGVRLWVGASGTVLRAQVFRSTGDAARDSMIARAVQKTVISQPPPRNMPQPVSVVIVAHAQ